MRRALRITAWTAGSLLLFIAVLILSALIIGNTATGKIWIEQITWHLTKGHVRLSGLGGSFPSAPTLEKLELVDARGIWLDAQHISLRWSPLAFLAWRVSAESLQVERLDMERTPVSDTPDDHSKPHVPDIDVHQASIGTLELGEQLTHVRTKLTAQGSVHLISVDNLIAHVTARRTDGSPGNYESTLRFDSKRMDAQIKVEEPADGPLENLLHYPGLGALEVNGSLSGPRNAETLQLNIQAGELRARAQGTFDLTGKSANLVYGVDAPAMSPRPGLAWKKVALHGRWQGTFSAPHADGQLDVEALQSPGGVGAENLSATLKADGGSLGVKATINGLVIPGPQPRLLADAPVRIDGTVDLANADRPVKISVEHRLFALHADAATAKDFSTTFDAQLRDLAPLAAFADQRARGTGEIKGTLKEDSAGWRADVDASTQLANDSTTIAKLLGGPARLKLVAALTDQRIEVEQFVFNGRVLSAQVSGKAARSAAGDSTAVQSLTMRYVVNIANMGALASGVAGTLKANGSLDGPINAFSTQLQLTSNLSVHGSPLETIQASVKASGLPAQTKVTLLAQGRFDSAPAQLDASLQRATGGTYQVTVHRGEWKSAHLEGAFTTAANFEPQNGAANLRIDHLADLQGLIGTKIDGDIQGSLALHPVERHTQAQLQLDANNITTGDFAGNAHLTATGTLNDLSLKLSAQSPDLKGEPASIDATAHLNTEHEALDLEHADVHYHAQVLKLLAPARLSYANGVVIHQLKLGLQHAVATIDGRVSPVLDVRASVRQVDPTLINAFLPDTLADGKVEADAELKGSPSAPAGVVTVKATGVRFAAARELHVLDLHTTARLDGTTAVLDGKLSAGEESQLVLSGSVPLGGSGALNLKLNGQLDAGLANPILEARGERAAGELKIDTTVTGRPDAPEIAGAIDLADGDVRDYTQGLHLSGITAHATGSHGTLKLEKLTARASPGDLSISGTIGLLQPKMPIELQMTARNAQPFASDILTSNLNADLKIKGTLRERIEVSGTVNLNRTIVGIPNSLPPEVAVLDVRRPGQKAPNEGDKLIVALDVNLHSPRELLVQGRGLNAELGGDVHLGGTTDSVHADGGFELVRGTFSLASSQLTFTSGKVSFNGVGLKHKIDPTLDFTAETTSADATATLHITGYADAPQFDLSSSPPLPQDEILARLLFGESAAQLTVVQVAEIGAALATLGGVGGSGPNPLVKVQKALGLDRLSVGGGTSTGVAGQTSGAAIEAGRYVTNRVFVGAKQSTTGFSQIEVDVDLSKHLKLQTRLGNGTATTQGTTPENDPGSSIGLMYQFEY
jgi:translocation and assembly module TamB